MPAAYTAIKITYIFKHVKKSSRIRNNQCKFLLKNVLYLKNMILFLIITKCR